MSDTTFDPPYHQPRRGSDVEDFIQRHRDEHAHKPGMHPSRRRDAAYFALDNMLDEYRLKADTGAWLWEVTETPALRE